MAAPRVEYGPVGTVGVARQDWVGLVESLDRSRNAGSCWWLVHYLADHLPNGS